MNNRAYTLIEMLILIAIISSLLLLLSPSIEKIRDLVARMEIKTLVRDINHYKNRSISENKSYFFKLDPGKNSYYFTSNIDYKIVCVYERELHSSIKIQGNNFNNSIKFNTSSKPTGAGSLYLNCNGKNKVLVISPITGNISIKDQGRKGGWR